MKKVMFGIAAAVLVIAGSLFVFAQKGMHKDGPGFGGRGHFGGAAMFLRGLDLTDEQKAKVKEIMDASKANVEPLMKQLHDNHAKIAGLGTDGKFDQAQIEAIAADQGSTTAKLIVEKEKVKAQIFAILTDEQKAKAAEMRTKFEERFKGTDGKGFRGKPGGMEF